MFEHAHTHPAPLEDPDLHVMTRSDGRVTCSRGDFVGDDLGEWWDHICEIGRARRARAVLARSSTS